jgi:hypothetical protein
MGCQEYKVLLGLWILGLFLRWFIAQCSPLALTLTKVHYIMISI